MEFFRKNGKFIELGGFGASFIFIFLPFLSANIGFGILRYNMLGSPTSGLGIFSLLLILAGIALTAINCFKPELLDKLGNAKKPIADFGALGLSGLVFLFVLIAGLSNTSIYSLGIGFFFLLLAMAAVIASCVIKKFVLKEGGVAPVAPQAPVQPQPVMGGQPIPQQPAMNPVPQQPVNPVPVQPQPMPQQPAAPVAPVPQQPVNNEQPPVNPNQQ